MTTQVQEGEVIKPLVKVTKPNEQKFKAQTDDISKKIKVLEEKRANLVATSEELGGGAVKEQENTEFEAVKTKFSKLKTNLDALRNDRNEVLNRIKTMQAQAKKTRESLICPNEAALKMRLRELEIQMETGLGRIEEKKIIREIETLRKSKKDIMAYEALQSSLQEEQKKLDALKEKIKVLDGEIKVVADERNAIFQKRKEARDQNDSKKQKRSAIYHETTDLRKQINELYGELRSLRDNHKSEMVKWREYVRAEQKQKRKERIEQEKADAKKKKIEQLVARASEAPFATDIQLCDNLINYLESKIAEGAPPATASAPVAAAMPAKEGEELVLVRKEDNADVENFFGAFAGNGKKKGKKKNSNREGVARVGSTHLKHNLTVFQDFQALKLTVPATKAEAVESIKQLKAAKADFESKSDAEKERLEKERDAAIAALEKEEAEKPEEAEEEDTPAPDSEAKTEEPAPVEKEEKEPETKEAEPAAEEAEEAL
eukprot:GCRY01001907.1.p1 GENE.GCRY01001907.1~~GCRY01001907.1.p1  ORF type:complete len:489 (+),score=139.46 GCRY01001907.1:125-1591(+)